MSDVKHGFWWKLAHLNFGESDDDFALKALTEYLNEHEPRASKEDVGWMVVDESDWTRRRF